MCHRSRPFVYFSLPVVIVVALVLATILSGCSNRDKTIGIAEDDPEMLAAIEKARSTLPQFWQAFEKQEPGTDGFSLKVEITDKKESEHFWLTNIERKETQIMGTIDNEPDVVQSVRLGDRIPIDEADISDWMYMQDGKMVGNYTLRVLFKKMPPDEVEKYRSILADP